MNLQHKIEAMSNKYRELRHCQFPVVKRMIIEELKEMAYQATQFMNSNESPSNSKKRRQIDDVLKKCGEIEKELELAALKDIGGNPNRGNRPSQYNHSLNQSQLSRIAAHSVMFHEIRSSELKIKPQEYNDVYNRMVNNLEVMKEIEVMVKEQGNDLEKVDEYLELAYENTEMANKELSEAQELQKKSRRMKFKMTISGFFAAIGYGILGFPGMVLGLFTGHKATG